MPIVQVMTTEDFLKELIRPRRQPPTEPETDIVSQPNSTFLALPQKIRSHVYQHLLPTTRWRGGVIHEQKTKVAAVAFDLAFNRKYQLRDLATQHKDNLPTESSRKTDAFFALYRTCRQLYEEVLPLWYKHNVVYIKEDSLGFSETIAWFEGLSRSTRRHVKHVEIRVLASALDTLRNGLLNVVDWLSLEHVLLKQGTQLHIMLPNDEVSLMWYRVYCASKRWKKDGASPATIRYMLNDAHSKMLRFSAQITEGGNVAHHSRVRLPWKTKSSGKWWRYWSKKAA